MLTIGNFEEKKSVTSKGDVMQELEEFVKSMNNNTRVLDDYGHDNIYDLCDQALEDLDELDAQFLHLDN